MNVPIIGVIENLAYFKCGTCHMEHTLFSVSNLMDIASEFSVLVIGRLPLDSRIAAACDRGLIELFEGDWLNGVTKEIEIKQPVTKA